MNSDGDPALAAFVSHFLEANGAVVEATAEGLEALLPERLAKRWSIPEMVQVACVAPGQGASFSPATLVAAYGSPVLEQMIGEATAVVPVVQYRARFDYLKSAGFERLLREQFNFNGASVTVENHATIQADYLELTFALRAQSDEQKQGLVKIALNLDTDADVTGIDFFQPGMDIVCATTGKDFPWDGPRAERILAWAEKRVQTAVAEALQPFEARMNRRLRRDAASLVEYYAALEAEMNASLQRPGLSEALKKERLEKIALLPAEMARKQDDLFKKYSIRAELRLCAGLLMRTPAVKLLTHIRVGKSATTHSLVYNPFSRLVEPLVCPGCGASTYNLHCRRHAEPCCPRCAAG